MHLTLIISDNCEACERAKNKLQKINIKYPKIIINVRNIRTYNKRGILITPALLVNEELFSYGEIDESKLMQKIS